MAAITKSIYDQMVMLLDTDLERVVALDDAGGALDGTTWTYVADRESDIYELFQRSSVNDWSYVIRASQPRSLATARHLL